MIKTIKKDTATYPIVFFMADSTDHVTGKTGLSPTVTLSKNGAAFGAAAGAVTEIGNGFYKVAGNATDSNTLGSLILHAEATGADDTDMILAVVTHNPYDVAEPGDEMILSSDYNAAKTAATQASVDAIVLDPTIIASVAISAAEAAQVESGTLAISTDHTFEGVITSSSTEAINTAKLILAIKDSRYEDSESMILIDSENGLTVVDGAEYATGTNGSISASGSSGDWSIGLKISKVVASLLSAYVGRTLDAELKAILADGDAISVWTGECKIARGVVRAVS